MVWLVHFVSGDVGISVDADVGFVPPPMTKTSYSSSANAFKLASRESGVPS